MLKKARESDLTDLVRESGAYLKGLWLRLNGGGTSSTRVRLPRSLPLPASTAKEVRGLAGRRRNYEAISLRIHFADLLLP